MTSDTPFDLVIAAQRTRVPLAPKVKPKKERASRKAHDLDLDRLKMKPDEVGTLTGPQREARVVELLAEAHSIYETAIALHVTGDGHKIVAVVGLFSGGNDSTLVMHVFRDRITHAGMANTGVGIEQTREYVRATCARWGVPLLERKAPRQEDSYREQVLRHGFPGPGRHARMYQRLKERCFEQIQRELVSNPRRERMLFIGGRRRTESKRRMNVVEFERIGSAAWCSPFINWTTLDMNTYRLMKAREGDPVPVNIVSDVIHMSGECLCGAMAHYGERDEVEPWYPEPFDDIDEMQDIIRAYPPDFVHPAVIEEHKRAVLLALARGKKKLPNRPKPIPEYAKTWGWGGDPRLVALSGEKPTNGRMCGNCGPRYEQAALAIPTEENAA